MAVGTFQQMFRAWVESRTKRLAHLENIERLRCGYPPIGIEEKAKDIEISGIIDMTEKENEQPESRQANIN